MPTVEEILRECTQRLKRLGGYLDIDSKKVQLSALEEQMAGADFWNNRKQAEQTSRQARVLKDSIVSWEDLQTQLQDLVELHEMASEENDTDTLGEIEADSEKLVVSVEGLEFRTMLDGDDDAKNAILVIHSGAGGTEAADWAEMLMRMYTRWTERNDMQSSIMDMQPGEEAGVKGVTIEVKGDFAYGYLKAEAGVHRLVRISPFDSSSRRHTSFASVFVYPEVDDDIEVDLKDEELKVEVYRAGGAGGQHVNKTSSAVRITHLPTNIVVQCQNERSQLKNKATALKVLAARVYQYFKDEEDKKLQEVESSKKSIDFGSQIRSYVFHPYNLVKDHRTNHETGNVQAVMDGDIDAFIKSFLTQE
ncbi:MAG: peptide chain release factor 2 [Candidatus Latescibacterota bacterium]|nr:peptide chain release factor 2 [Candidatus Latescibacterota bacterium]MEE2726202.1 peptide chain release factor 2 [Candidatus Latescibacterota bacterium]